MNRQLLLAQSLGEYSAQGSVVSGVQRLADSISSTVSSTSPTAWLVLGAIVVATLWLWSRRPSR